jgi:four helix bundle protein
MNDSSHKQLTFFRFEDLRIYHKALDHIFWVQQVSSCFETDHGRSLAEAYCANARKIALQIAEGSAREKSHFVNYLKEAKSAIRACLVLSTIALRQGYINEHQEDESRNQLMEMTKMLGALITSLQKGPAIGSETFEDEFDSARNW